MNIIVLVYHIMQYTNNDNNNNSNNNNTHIHILMDV